MSTPTTQQRIEEAAEKDSQFYFEHPGFYRKGYFHGANFVLNTILPEFAEWLDGEDWHKGSHGLWHKGPASVRYTFSQLIELFKNRNNG